MNKIYSKMPYRMAGEYPHNMLQNGKEAKLARSAKPNTPKIWEYAALSLGNLPINSGCNLKSQSAFAQLSKKRS